MDEGRILIIEHLYAIRKATRVANTQLVSDQF